MLSLHRIDQIFGCEDGPHYLLFYSGYEVILDRVVSLPLVFSLRLAVLLKSLIAELITIFKDPVVLASLLHGVICQMREHVVGIVRVD